MLMEQEWVFGPKSYCRHKASNGPARDPSRRGQGRRPAPLGSSGIAQPRSPGCTRRTRHDSDDFSSAPAHHRIHPRTPTTDGLHEARVITRCRHGRVSGNLRFVVTNRSFDGLTALGDPTRRAIFDCLAERPRAVGELADALPVSRPAVSQHLKVLKEAGLVTDNANGTRRIYRLNPEGVAAMRDQLDTYWNRALEGYVRAVDETRQEKQ